MWAWLSTRERLCGPSRGVGTRSISIARSSGGSKSSDAPAATASVALPSQHLLDDLVDDLAVRDAPHLGHDDLHHGAHVLRGRGAGLLDRVADDRADLILGELRREVLLDERELGLFLRREVRPPALPVRVDRVAPLLRVGGDDGLSIGILEDVADALLDRKSVG